MMNTDELLKQLQRIAPSMTAGQLTLLIQMASSMRQKIKRHVSPASDIMTPVFEENFANRLLIHHALSEEKLKKKSFEYAFRDAAKADGKDAEITSSSVHPGADVTVDAVRFSLKTEASKNISKTGITISKFMEARAIRGKNVAELAELTVSRLGEHLAGYERILMLRAFSSSANEVQYIFVEIPHSLLMLATGVRADDIVLNKGPNGGGRAKVRLGEEVAFSLNLDGSVEKITISGLRVDLCRTHAIWNIPTIIPSADSGDGELNGE